MVLECKSGSFCSSVSICDRFPGFGETHSRPEASESHSSYVLAFDRSRTTDQDFFSLVHGGLRKRCRTSKIM